MLNTTPRRTHRLRWRLGRFLLLLAVFLQLCLVGAANAISNTLPQPPAQVWVLDLQGAIGPASSDLFTRALSDANRANADLFVLRIDTPGGLDLAMRDMIQAILASKVPVVTYVFPQGARAASAGTYILYASHIAAMAPATNLGAATPVQMGAPEMPAPSMGQPPANKSEDGDTAGNSPKSPVAPQSAAASNKNPQDGLTKLERKQINDAVAYIRSLAQLRGRNAAWGEQAVRAAASLSARDALQQGVIDLIAPDLDSLMQQLDGRSVKIADQSLQLHLNHYVTHHVQPDWRSQLLAVITDPNVAYILMLVGIYGIIMEFAHPGTGVPGVVGGICLLTALYAMQLLPISYAALSLIVLGIGLMIAEALTPGFGILGTGGVGAFLVGSVMLMDSNLPGFRIALPVIAAIGCAFFGMLWVILRLAWKSRRQPIVSGVEELLGAQALALKDFSDNGQVLVRGEVWQARARQPVKQGQKVRVTAVEGLVLRVEGQS